MNQQKLIGAIIVIIMGLLIIIGSILPWATAQSVFGSMSKNGIEGDGKITLATGIITLLCGIAILVSEKNSGWIGLAVIASGASLAVAIIDLVDVSNKLSGISNEYVKASAGIGLYIVLVGGIVGIIGALVSATKGKPTPSYVCPNCGGSVEQTSSFCPHCGYQFVVKT
jgi:hypothetical protein